jgi:hypothetical protein
MVLKMSRGAEARQELTKQMAADGIRRAAASGMQIFEKRFDAVSITKGAGHRATSLRYDPVKLTSK